MATVPVPTTADPVANMASLQAVVDAAARGDVITLTPRAIYRGTLTLRAKTGTTPIIITTNLPLGLPAAGHRLDPTLHLAALPIIEVSVNNASAIKTCDPVSGVSSYYTLLGLEVRANAFGGGTLVSLGSSDNTLGTKQDSAARVPTDLVVDRCYIHGLPVTGQKRGVGLDCLRGTVIESYISDCWGIGQDAQAIQGHNGLGTYIVRNNYLEGGAENFLMGGSDPIIPALVPTNLIFTRNDVTRPVAWRSPILSTPTNVVVNIGGSGGTLPAATYSYRVMARVTSYASNVARSTPAAAVATTITLGQLPQVSWTAVANATSYYVYRIGPVDTQRFSTTSTSFADSGTAGVVEAVPGNGTLRSVKNLFEIKNFTQARVYGNRFSNHWVESQPGPSIVFTPVNQNGTNPATHVADITFEYNRIDHVAALFTMCGHDTNGQASDQTERIIIRHNAASDVGTQWGAGSHREVLVSRGSVPPNPFEGLDGLTVEHNTFLATGMNAAVYLSGYNTTLGFPTHAHVVYRNNITRRGGVGIFGDNSAEGTKALADYAAGYTCTRNAIAGITVSAYPPGNFGPTETTLQAQFVDYAAGNYRLASTSIYKGQATDGTDLGADLDLIDAAYAGTIAPPQTVTWGAVGGTGTITVATAIDCPWSAISNDSWIVITNSAAHVGGGTVTYSVASNPSGPRQGTMTIAGTTITVVQTTGGVTTTTMGVGALALLGRAPTLKRTFVISPGVGALALAGAAASDLVTAPPSSVIAPPKGSLLLTGLAPSLGGTALEQPGAVALLLAGLAPNSVVRRVISPGVGALVLAGLAVTRASTGSALLGVGTLTLLGRAPTRSQAQFPTFGLGALTLTGLTPTRLELVPRLPGVGALVLAGLAPTISQAHKPTAGAGALGLTGLAPTVGRTFLAQPGVGALVLGSSPGGATTLFSRVPDPGQLVLAGLAPVSLQALLAEPGVGALVLAGAGPITAPDTLRLVLRGTLTLQGHLVVSIATYTTQPGAGALLLAGRAPTLGQSYFFETQVGALTLTGQTPSRLGVGTVAPDPGALTLAGLAPDRTVQAIFPGAVGALLLAGLAPAITLSGGTEVTAAPSEGLLTLLGLAPSILEAIVIEVPAGALILESLPAPVIACSPAVTPTLVTVIAAGGVVTIDVAIGDTCPWTAVSLDSWLTLTPDADVGPGSVIVTVAPYTGTTDPREGSLDIAGIRVVVIQVAAGCTFVVAPASIHAGAPPTFGSLTVTTNIGCSWSAFAAEPWITLTGTTGTGSGSVAYALAVNPLTSSRHGTITVAGQIIPVLQRGRNATPGPRDCPEI